MLRNMSAEDIRQSVDEYRREIAKAQIVMFPGGFSAAMSRRLCQVLCHCIPQCSDEGRN